MVTIRLLVRVMVYWLAVIIGCTGLYLLNGYPDVWVRVKHGMTRSQVHQLCGKPDTSSWPEKGDFYFSIQPWGKWEFLVSPREAGVGHTRIWLVLGSDFKYYIREDGYFLKAIRQQFF